MPNEANLKEMSSNWVIALFVVWRPGSGSVFRIRIRIQKAVEKGSDTEPDPKHWVSPYVHMVPTYGLNQRMSKVKMLEQNFVPTIYCTVYTN